MDINDAAFWPLIIAASLVVVLALSLRVSVWKAFVILGGPAYVFTTLNADNSTALAGPLTGAAVAWLALALVLRIPLRVAFGLFFLPVIFGGMAYALAIILLSDQSLLGQT